MFVLIFGIFVVSEFKDKRRETNDIMCALCDVFYNLFIVLGTCLVDQYFVWVFGLVGMIESQILHSFRFQRTFHCLVDCALLHKWSLFCLHGFILCRNSFCLSCQYIFYANS